MSIIRSGNGVNFLTIDTTSKAMRATRFTTSGQEVSYGQAPTFACSIQAVGAVANPTDIFTISGSPTKIVRVLSLAHSTTTTAAGSVRFFLLKRFSPDYSASATLPVPIPGVSLDSFIGPTATCLTFTANPPQLGGLVSTMNIKTTASMLTTPASWGSLALGYNRFSRDSSNQVEMIPAFRYMTVEQEVTLRGLSEVLALNFNAAALVAGQITWVSCLWTESDK